MMPMLLDPGWVADEPMPASTGTKLGASQRYYRGVDTGKLYFRDTDGTFYELCDPSSLFQWPEELTRDGRLQMAPADGDDARPRRTGADRAKAFRERRRKQRRNPHDGPENFAQAEAQALP